MIKIFTPVGASISTVGGDTTGRTVICKEVTPGEFHCANCCFYPAFPCGIIACRPEERPDGKRVIFMVERRSK